MDAVVSSVYREAIARGIPPIASWVWGGGDENLLLGVFTNDFTPTASSVVGDFTVPTYTGYANISVGDLNSLVYLDPATGNWHLRPCANQVFQPSNDTGLPQTAYGYFVWLSGSPAKPLWAARFDESFTWQSADNALIIQPELILQLFAFA